MLSLLCLSLSAGLLLCSVFLRNLTRLPLLHQVISEVLAVRRAVKYGDSALHYIVGDPYNAVQVLRYFTTSASSISLFNTSIAPLHKNMLSLFRCLALCLVSFLPCCCCLWRQNFSFFFAMLVCTCSSSTYCRFQRPL